MSSRVRIREASPVDAESIAALLKAAFLEFEPLYTPGGFRATTPASDEIGRRFAEGPIWVAERDGRIIGTASVVPQGDGLYIRSMAVHPAARGQGVAALLLETVERHARAGARSRLVLSTTPFLDGAIRLYERAGFRRTEDGPHDLFGTPLMTMVKELAGGSERAR
jgi:GNAT superfamily N-acetyltransferase